MCVCVSDMPDIMSILIMMCTSKDVVTLKTHPVKNDLQVSRTVHVRSLHVVISSILRDVADKDQVVVRCW